MSLEYNTGPDEKLRVELDASTLARLLESQLLSVNEFRCLDGDSKACVWRLCLNSCAKCIHADRRSGGEAEVCPGPGMCPAAFKRPGNHDEFEVGGRITAVIDTHST